MRMWPLCLAEENNFFSATLQYAGTTRYQHDLRNTIKN